MTHWKSCRIPLSLVLAVALSIGLGCGGDPDLARSEADRLDYAMAAVEMYAEGFERYRRAHPSGDHAAHAQWWIEVLSLDEAASEAVSGADIDRLDRLVDALHDALSHPPMSSLDFDSDDSLIVAGWRSETLRLQRLMVAAERYGESLRSLQEQEDDLFRLALKSELEEFSHDYLVEFGETKRAELIRKHLEAIPAFRRATSLGSREALAQFLRDYRESGAPEHVRRATELWTEGLLDEVELRMPGSISGNLSKPLPDRLPGPMAVVLLHGTPTNSLGAEAAQAALGAQSSPPEHARTVLVRRCAEKYAFSYEYRGHMGGPGVPAGITGTSVTVRYLVIGVEPPQLLGCHVSEILPPAMKQVPAVAPGRHIVADTRDVEVRFLRLVAGLVQ